MPVALLLLLLGEGRRREPRRLAAEVPVALLLLEEGRRHEPRELAAPLVLLPLLRGGGDTNPANSLRRCAACSAGAGRGTTTPRPGGRFCMAKCAAISPVFAGTAKSDALPARPPVSAMPTPAHIVQCGCSRRLAAVVLPRHSSGGQRPKG